MMLLIAFWAISVATAAWTDSPRYGPDYADGSQMPRSSNCIPCEERSNSNTLEFRGNGADNLGYDWSPKAWGGPAFPKSVGGRDGRRMPGQWDDKCRDCSQTWSRFTERPDRPPWGSSTEQPTDVSTVTSSVLGIRLQDDKRLPVEWGGRSMRWDGFRNGMAWERPDRMDRRDGSDQDGKGHYASDWSYSSRDPAGSGTRWNGQRPWTQPWDQRKPQNEYDQRGGNPPFGSSYPSSDRFPSSSSSTWRPSTSSYPTNKPYYHYPTSGRPEIIKVRPGYGVVDQPDSGAPWNYSPDGFNSRPSQYPSRPTDNYLPQNSRPDYGRPTEGVPGTAIWNGRPDEYRPGQGSRPPNGVYQGFITEIHDPNYRPGYPNDRPPIDPSHNRFPDRYDRPVPGQGNSLYHNSRPETGSPGYDTERPQYGSSRPGLETDRNRYPSKDYDRNPYGSDRYPSQNPDRPSFGSDRYPSQNPDRPSYGSDRYPSQNPDRPSYGSDRYPSQNPDRPSYGSDRYPSQNPDRPSYGSDRYPSQNHDRNPYGSNRYPSKDTDRNPYGSDRYPSKDSDRNPYGSDRYPSRDPNPNQYGSDRDRDRYPTYDRNPSYSRPQNSDSDRHPSYDRDRERYPSDSNNDRYPSRPSSGDHDRGPNPGSDQGSWNYGEDSHKDGTYRRSGGSYPSYKGGQYYTSGYLASASTPAISSHEEDKKNDETTVASTLQEK